MPSLHLVRDLGRTPVYMLVVETKIQSRLLVEGRRIYLRHLVGYTSLETGPWIDDKELANAGRCPYFQAQARDTDGHFDIKRGFVKAGRGL